MWVRVAATSWRRSIGGVATAGSSSNGVALDFARVTARLARSNPEAWGLGDRIAALRGVGGRPAFGERSFDASFCDTFLHHSIPRSQPRAWAKGGDANPRIGRRPALPYVLVPEHHGFDGFTGEVEGLVMGRRLDRLASCRATLCRMG
jgi:hypothetical protein